MVVERLDRRLPDGDPEPRRPAPRPTAGPAAVMLCLGLGVAVTSLLGPVGLGVLHYRTSATTVHQLMGSDLAGLVVVAPLSLLAGLLWLRGHPAAPVLALGPSVAVVYTFAQMVIGQEYLRLPGNVERFFPLLLLVFVLAETAAVLAWTSVPRRLPPLSARVRRTAGVTLLAIAAFLVLGLHLPTLLQAWADPAAMTEYASSPTPFWMVKLMDLGIVVPAALVTGVGLLRGRAWADRATYAIVTGYTCLASSVAAMAFVMIATGDPDASVALLVGFTGFAAALAALCWAMLRPLARLG